jgi:Coenzyme PQQ synthesis protein D (PqqD).
MKLKPSIVICDSGFVFNPETGDSFVANKIGFEIIHLMKDGEDIETVYKYLVKKFNISHSALYKDVEDFMWELRNHKLIVKDDN